MADQPNRDDSTMAVRDAINNTPLGQLQSTLELHSRSFAESGGHLLRWAVQAEWEQYEHPDVLAPAVAYRAKRHGHMMVMPVVGNMQDDDVIRFDDPPEKMASPDTTIGGLGVPVVMGTAEGYTLGPGVDFVVALVGPPDEGEGGDVLWTLFAGDPVRPSRLPASEWGGKRVTAREAIELGVTHVRVGR